MPQIIQPNPVGDASGLPAATFRIPIVHTVDGVLRDYDAITLLSPADVLAGGVRYGIVRIDTEEILVAAGDPDAPADQIPHQTDADGNEIVGKYVYVATGLAPGATYRAYLFTRYGGVESYRAFTFTARSPEYYATRAGLLSMMGQEGFDGEIRLSPDSLVADEQLARDILSDADAMVDGFAYAQGFTSPGVAYDPHLIATNDQPLFNSLRMWAELWARGRAGWLRPGEPGGGFDPNAAGVIGGSPGGGENTDVRGKYARSMAKAEHEIKALLMAKRARLRAAGMSQGGIGVGFSRCVPCGIDARVANNGNG